MCLRINILCKVLWPLQNPVRLPGIISFISVSSVSRFVMDIFNIRCSIKLFLFSFWALFYFLFMYKAYYSFCPTFWKAISFPYNVQYFLNFCFYLSCTILSQFVFHLILLCTSTVSNLLI